MPTRTTIKTGAASSRKAAEPASKATPRGKAVPAPRKPRNLAAQLPEVRKDRPQPGGLAGEDPC